MFTGIVEEVGTVVGIATHADVRRTTVKASVVLDDLKIGDSISLDGACHTVVTLDGESFSVESVPETLKRTTMGRLVEGSGVNLERPLRVGDRLGGHFVMGHVDGKGRVAKRIDHEASAEFRIEMPAGLSAYVSEKGSVTVDGVSLTVVEALADGFTFSAIPHTLEVTTLGDRTAGDEVNLEVDMVARYLKRFLDHDGPG